MFEDVVGESSGAMAATFPPTSLTMDSTGRWSGCSPTPTPT